MKKLLFLALPLVVFSGVANAAACLQNQTLAQLVALGATGCSIGDKVFQNFTGTFAGADATDTFTFTGPLGPTLAPFYQLNLNAGTAGVLTAPLSFSYQVRVDAAVNAVLNPGTTAAITRVTGGIQDNGNAGSGAQLLKGVTVNTGSGSCGGVNYAETAGTTTTNTACNLTGATLITVVESFTYTGTVGASSVTGFGNTFTQTLTPTTGVPEPMSMLLLGSGLLGFGFIGRKRFVR